MRWAVLGGLVLAAPAFGIWVFLDAFPRMTESKSAKAAPLSDEAWVKLRSRLDVRDLHSRPRWLRHRIEFDHPLSFWIHSQDSSPEVTAILEGDYRSDQLEAAAKHAAGMAFLAFRGAKRSLTLHLWSRRDAPRDRAEIRHCVVTYAVSLSPNGPRATRYSIDADVTSFDSSCIGRFAAR